MLSRSSSQKTSPARRDGNSESPLPGMLQVRDVVWARPDRSFPYWPACVLSLELLPASVLAGLNANVHHDTDEGRPKLVREITPKTLFAKRKVVLFFFGRSDYDFVSVDDVQTFSEDDEYMSQEIKPSLRVSFDRGVALARVESYKRPEDRLSWLVGTFEEHIPTIVEGDFLPFTPKDESNYIEASIVDEVVSISSEVVTSVEIAELKLPTITTTIIETITEIEINTVDLTAETVFGVAVEDNEVTLKATCPNAVAEEAQPQEPEPVAVVVKTIQQLDSVVGEEPSVPIPNEIVSSASPAPAPAPAAIEEAVISTPPTSLAPQEEVTATSAATSNSGGTAGDRTSKVFKGRAIRQSSGLTLFDGDSANTGPSLFGSPAVPSNTAKKIVKSDPFGAPPIAAAVGASPFDQIQPPLVPVTNSSVQSAVAFEKTAPLPLPPAIVATTPSSSVVAPPAQISRSNSSSVSAFGASAGTSTKKAVAGFSGFDRQASSSNSAFAAQELFMSNPGPVAAAVPAGRRTSAADVFSSQPPPAAIIPPVVSNASGVMAPPSAPGVKPQVVVPAAIPVPPAPGSGDGSSDLSSSRSVSGTKNSNNAAAKKAVGLMNSPPPNAIVTPHGYVLAAAPAAPPSVPGIPVSTGVHSHQQGGPSIFSPAGNANATMPTAAWPSGPSTVDSSSSVSYSSGPLGRYQRPVSAVSCLGFGGKLVVWLPDRQLFPPVYRSSTGGGDRMRAPQQLPLLGARPAPFKVYSIDKLSFPAENQQSVTTNIEELKRFQELLRQPFASLVDFTTKMAAKPTRSLLSQGYQQKQAGSSLSSAIWSSHESFLWEVLSLLLARSSTKKGDADATTVEQRIVQLLVARSQDMQQLLPSSSSPLRTTSTAPTWQHHLNHAEELEDLLVAGRRDDALELSINRQDWATAMLLSSIASLDKYQEVVRLYSASRFAPQSPSSLLMMAFSNQGMTALQPPPSKPAAFISTSETQLDEMMLLRYWMKDTAALLANQVSGWQELITTLSTRLLEKTGDAVLAQIILLCADLLSPIMPEQPSTGKASAPPTSKREESSSSNKSTVNKDLWLLGGSRRVAVHDVESLTAFRMSEVLEAILAQAAGLQQPQSTGTGKNAQPSSSSSSMLGWLVGGNSAANRGASSVSGASSGAAMSNKQHYERWTSYRLFLLPLKLRFAMILADHGIIDQAVAYVTQVQQLVRAMSDERSPERQALGNNYSKLSKKMLQALEEMEDRLNTYQHGLPVVRADGSKDSVKSSSNASSNKPSSWGGLGTWSISAASLRSFVDGPAQSESTAAATTMPQAVGPRPPNSQSNQYPQFNASHGTPGMVEVDLSDGSHQQQYQQQYQQQQQYQISQHSQQQYQQQGQPAPFSGAHPHSMSNYPQQYPPGRAPPPSSVSAANLTSPSAASGSTGWFVGNTPPTASPPSSTAGTSNGSSAPPSNNYGSQNLVSMGAAQGGGYNNQGGYGQPAGIDSGGNYPQPQPPQAIDTAMSRPRSGAELSSNGASQQLNPTAAAAKDNAKEVKKGGSAADLAAPTGGLFRMMRKGIIKLMAPNAHDASENIGGALDAYFDKDKNCWVFPGEEAQAPPALPPPPTGMMGGGGQSQSQKQNNGMPASMSYSAFGPPSSSAPSTSPAGVDPLAALMAPPPRNMSMSTSSNANSSAGGLDQLMAPPSFRRSAAGSGTGSSNGLNSVVGGPLPSVNIWKPPAAPVTVPAPIAGGDWPAPMTDLSVMALAPPAAEAGNGDYYGKQQQLLSNDGMMAPPPPSSQFGAPPPPTGMAPPVANDFSGEYPNNNQGGYYGQSQQHQQHAIPPPPPSMMPPPPSL